VNIKKVLVVDDEKHMQELVKYHLLKNGYEVKVAGNGLEGIEAVERDKPDLIISDIMMPKIDGYEFCRRIRDNKDTKTIPFIFLTAKGQLPDKIQGLKTGADDYIVKPFNPQELIQMVKSRSRRVEAYLEEANLDELTGIYNLRYLRGRLREVLNKAIRLSQYLSICFIDIDRFGKVNDSFGHPAGDTVLKRVAELIKENIRFTDILARYGGEEFVVVMEGSKTEDAYRSMERVRQSIETANFKHKDKELELKITVSVGIAGFPKNGCADAELIEKADQALLRAKEQGKNKVIIYEEE
jgi:two-component system cell cycle response regulator